jgi:CheY-like chemotaxis protein
MDLQMPLMDGYQATAAIRRLGGKYRQLPILALTASAVIDVRDNVLAAGMNDFLTKPFEPNELYKKIARHAASYRAATAEL